MKSIWRVMERPVAGRTFYQVYRLNDVCADNTEKNRETWGGYYDSEADALALAEKMNEEAKHGRTN